MAMHELCGLYWRPLYSFMRRSGHTREDAEDFTQEFLAQLIEKRYLERAAQEKGKLRSFLLAYLKRFLADQRKAEGRLKRGGGLEMVSIDKEEAESRYLTELTDMNTPDLAFEKTWVLTLLEIVLSNLEAEYRADDRGELFAALKPLLQWGGDDEPLGEIAEQLGMREGAVKVAVFRLRKRYRQALRQQVMLTLADGENVDDEMRYLFQLLNG